MMMEQRPLWAIINDIDTLRASIVQGYKVLLCTEDGLPPDISMHPNVMKMSVLLPPYEVISLECDGRLDAALEQYHYYLTNYGASISIIDTVYISAVMGTPIAIYFGTEANDLHFPTWLLAFLMNFCGMAFNQNPACGGLDVDPARRAHVASTMYLMGEIQGIQFLAYHPVDFDFTQDVITKLMAEFRPAVPYGDYAAANVYFKDMAKQVNQSPTNKFGQTLYCPISGMMEKPT